MQKISIILNKKKVFIYLFSKIFFVQTLNKKIKKNFIYLLKVLYNFGFFDFRIFFLVKKNIKLYNDIKL